MGKEITENKFFGREQHLDSCSRRRALTEEERFIGIGWGFRNGI